MNVLEKDKKGTVFHINVRDLKAGMIFDAPVYFARGCMFLSSGLPVKAKDIQKLKELGITDVYTEGNLVANDSLFLNRKKSLEVSYIQPGEKKCLKIYNSIFKKMCNVFHSIKQKQSVDPRAIDNVINDLYLAVKEDANNMVQLILNIDNSSDDLVLSSINCAIISIVIGFNMKLTGHKIIQLATGALLHDVGMLRIPEQITGKKNKLSAKESELMRTHALHSFKIIFKELHYSQEVAHMGLHHHERWDGKGYPERLHGHKISIYTMIVAVVDSFVAMINKRPYRKHLLGYDAVKTIMRDTFTRFNSEIVKIFLKSIGIYPVGSMVLLNDYRIGKVIEVQIGSPLRPKIELVVDEIGRKVTQPQIIDLLRNESVYILKPLDARKVVGSL
ncbi:MAG: HD domain-containing protein [Spirochaetales bacterium]|nr:HD domain-containing protein [Spirochaetales bacterium]